MNKQLVDDTVNTLLSDHTEEYVHEQVGELMHDFIDSDWENEYESEEECYLETGRGEAESQVLQDIMASTGVEFELDEHCEIFERLAEEWSLTTD